MTTLYNPVLIESAEQAEALPIGTVAHHGQMAAVCTSEEPRPWVSGTLSWPHYVMVGWIALVPVTATIERMAAYAVMPDWDPERPEGQMATRYTTPWTPEEAK